MGNLKYYGRYYVNGKWPLWYSCFVWCSSELNTTAHKMEKWVLALNFDGGFWKTASHSPTRGKSLLWKMMYIVVLSSYHHISSVFFEVDSTLTLPQLKAFLSSQARLHSFQLYLEAYIVWQVLDIMRLKNEKLFTFTGKILSPIICGMGPSSK